MADETTKQGQVVGPVPTSTYNTVRDDDRARDQATVTGLWADASVGKAGKPRLDPFEKAAVAQATSAAVASSRLLGKSEEEVLAAAYQTQELGKTIAPALHDARQEQAFELTGAGEDLHGQTSERALLAQVEAAKAQETTLLDAYKAAFLENQTIALVLRNSGRPEFAVDPGFAEWYEKNQAELELGMPTEDREAMREMGSPAEVQDFLSRRRRSEELARQTMAFGPGLGIALNLVASFTDPVPWVIGGAATKTAQLARMGERLFRATQASRGLVLAEHVGGQVAGNVLPTAALDAAGMHITPMDYALSAVMGTVAGGALSAAAFRPLAKAVAEKNMELYQQAAKEAGPAASPEKIAEQADTIMRRELSTQDVLLAQVPDEARVWGDSMKLDLDPASGATPDPTAVFMPEHLRKAELEARGINQWTVESEAERTYLGEVFARAKRFAENNPWIPGRETIMSKVPWLATTSTILANSKNSVARFIAGTLLESPTGLTGRRRTAAQTKQLIERQYLAEGSAKAEAAYKAHRAASGKSRLTSWNDVESRESFFAEVTDEINRRGIAPDSPRNANPYVVRAADDLEAGFSRMRVDQQKVGTPGALRLGDTSVGYIARHLSPAWLLSSTKLQREAFGKLMAKQLDNGVLGEVGWQDPAFARRVASRYIDRAWQQAHGSVQVPAHVDHPDAQGMLRDALKGERVADTGEALSDEAIDKILGRLSRGGKGHTKARLDLDVSEEITLADGSTFRLGDAFEKNAIKIYQQQARAVSGEVALTLHGVPGRAGVNLLRKAMSYADDGSPSSKAEMRAFDQAMAEFYGQPMDGKAGAKWLDNLRLLTAASRLGGMAFTAFGESANAVGVIGAAASLRATAQIPKIISDLRAGRSNPILDSIETLSGPLGRDHEIIIPFQDVNDVRLITADTLNGFDRMVRAGSQALPWFNGFHYVLAAQQRGLTEQVVKKSWRYIREGKTDAALRDLGLDDRLVARLRNELDNVAEFDAAGNLTALNLTNGADADAIGEYLSAIRRGTNQIIQNTYIGETGYWAHHDMLRVLSQFRTFSVVAMEKQWTRQRAVHGVPKAVGLLLGSAGFALPIHLARVQLNAVGRSDRDEYIAEQTSPENLGRALLNYTSTVGLAGDILDVGYAVATGENIQGVRYGGAQGALSGFIPAAGYVEQGWRAATQHDPRDAIKALPGGSLPYVNAALNSILDDK